MMLPVPAALSVHQLLARVSKDYQKLKSSSVPAHSWIRAKKILCHDKFEIIDHSQRVGDCFTDFMQVTIKALRKTSTEPQTAKAPATSKTEARPPLKSFPNEPSTMKNFVKNLKAQGQDAPNAKRTKISDKKEKSVPVEETPEKESKNARKKRERKEAAKEKPRVKTAKR